jgi:predicted negative regulator of RcsB-dependent stress response
MFYIFVAVILIIAAIICWELYRAPVMEDDNSSLYDPTTTCWHDDDENKNHTEGDFH